MAAQPDINAILAALTGASNNSATPPQPGAASSVLPAGFPGQVPQSTGTPSLGGYALPQPTGSGSFDLSAVKPVNTGSVSLAEAIAKAKSIAADNNLKGSRDDPRHARSSYRHSRSRSRSPQRRDAFRDGNNPYRDERRGEDRRGGYGRDRSRSPGRGQSNYGSRDDKDSETITVKSALVGLIIGRAGENLRRVESETGARVQFVPAREPGAAQRQCTITGTLRQRDAAKREIFSTIEENGGGGGAAFDTRGSSARVSQPPPGRGASNAPPVPGEGETSRQILVPDKTVGLIIGRGGETIRDIQDRSACHINIVGENKSINGRRPVNLVGNKESVDKAEALIWEIVDSDTRESGQQPPVRPPAQSYVQQQQPMGGYGGGNDSANESIFVPSEAVGMIIGKGGESIKDMQNQTGCKINVNQPGNPDIERKIDLVGARTAIEAAKRAIWDKVDTVQQRDRASGRGGQGGGHQQHGGHHQQDPYSQPAQQPYGMPQQPAAAAPAAPLDPNDPYAPYGGYQNYVNMWMAATLAQQQGQQPPPQ